mgnify:FL=1
MERTCLSQLLAEAAGTPMPIREDVARYTATQIGSHLAGWFRYQPLYDKILAENPDFLN